MNLTQLSHGRYAYAHTDRVSRWNSSFDSPDGDNELSLVPSSVQEFRVPEMRILKYCIEMNFERSQI